MEILFLIGDFLSEYKVFQSSLKVQNYL